jgi:hypothetical protein
VAGDAHRAGIGSHGRQRTDRCTDRRVHARLGQAAQATELAGRAGRGPDVQRPLQAVRGAAVSWFPAQVALAATMRRVAGLLSISRHCTVPPIPVTSRQMLPSSSIRKT